MSRKKFKSFDEYIALSPDRSKKLLASIRAEVSTRIPDAIEVISYSNLAIPYEEEFPLKLIGDVAISNMQATHKAKKRG